MLALFPVSSQKRWIEVRGLGRGSRYKKMKIMRYTASTLPGDSGSIAFN